jgi:hypothetical protein
MKVLLRSTHYKLAVTESDSDLPGFGGDCLVIGTEDTWVGLGDVKVSHYTHECADLIVRYLEGERDD